MKVKNIVFMDSYFKGLYGAPKSMLELAEGVSKRNINVKIVSSKDDSLLEQARDKQLDTFSFDVSDSALLARGKLNYLTKILYIFGLLISWFSCLFNDPFKKADSICINDIRSFLLVLPLIFKYRRKVIWYVRINDRVKYISSIAARLSSKIILISSDCIDVFTVQEREKYKSKFSVINTGFDIDFNTLETVQKSHQEGDFVFISVGSICSRKNQLAVVDAFSAIPLENKYLYLIGSPANDADAVYNESVLALINNLDLQDKIKLVGYTKLVKSYLMLSDVFLFASHKEGLPRVLIEALLAGCFVISAKVDGVFDIIRSKDLGLITPNFALSDVFKNEFQAIAIESTQVDISKSDIASKSKEQFSYTKFIDSFINECN